MSPKRKGMSFYYTNGGKAFASIIMKFKIQNRWHEFPAQTQCSYICWPFTGKSDASKIKTK